MKKNYVLDTNVLLYDPQAIFKFEDNDVVIPIYVIEEVDQFKREGSERGRNARSICRFLDELRDRGSLSAGVSLDRGGSDRFDASSSILCGWIRWSRPGARHSAPGRGVRQTATSGERDAVGEPRAEPQHHRC